MRILLINPPRLHEIIGNNPSIIEEERGYNPPLGLLYVAAYLKKYSNYDVNVIDAQVEGLDYDGLKHKIVKGKPHVIGITTMTMTLIDVLKTARLVKEINPNITIVLGGPHTSLFPEETIQFSEIDFLVTGEGEEAFCSLVKSIDKGGDVSGIAGIVTMVDGKIINTGKRPYVKDIDKLPFPDRQLVPYKKYTSLLAKGKSVTTIITSRGCPFKCSFCDRPNMGKVFRARSATNVVDELEQCVQLGINEFLFYDDTFTVNKQRVLDICDMIRHRKLVISWDIRARIDTIDEEMLVSLKKAGCYGIHYGIEAGSERILKVLNKQITIEKALEVFKLTKQIGLSTLSYFMIGNPEETIEDIDETFKVMKLLKPDYVHLTILTPFPGTKVYSDGIQKGIMEKDYWKEFAENPEENFIPPHWGENFTKNELNALLIKGYKSFYLRPVYVLKRIIAVRSLSELKKKAYAGLKVLNLRK